jgi:hypothetical protein
MVKDQNITLKTNHHNSADRELRVLAHSYNILRVDNGIAQTLF